MKDIDLISEGDNFTAVNIGNFDGLLEHSYIHPKLRTEVVGKVFVGEAIHSSGTEISFQLLSPKKEISFLHKHRNHEEVYVIIKGKGQFQVDGKCFDVKEGSVVRIAPEGSRTLRNDTDNPMIYMCIQAQQGSLDSNYIFDGYRVEGEIKWDNDIK
jgi:mannose-6-phosphate isomerase-like protein (cupin superfamily)